MAHPDLRRFYLGRHGINYYSHKTWKTYNGAMNFMIRQKQVKGYVQSIGKYESREEYYVMYKPVEGQ